MPKIGYTIFCLALSCGLFSMIYWQNYFRKIISFAIFSSSSIILFITVSYKYNSIASFYNKEATILEKSSFIFTDPIPSVLMLTAIVVGISVQAIALSVYIAHSKSTESSPEKVT